MRFINRLGQKERLADKISALFPPHKIYIEPFFGGGGMFFNKPRSPINHINDLDNDIFNLWHVLTRQKDELIAYLENVPYSDSFFKWIKHNEPQNEIEKAVWFVVLSNWGYLGKPHTLKIDNGHIKKMTIQNLQEVYEGIVKYETVTIQNKDFRKFLKSISFNEQRDNAKEQAFIYCDKPYSKTVNNYGKQGKDGVWSETDDLDLLSSLKKMGIKFAISEYDNSAFEPMAKEAGLKKHFIGSNGHSGLSRHTDNKEIIWVNYNVPCLLF